MSPRSANSDDLSSPNSRVLSPSSSDGRSPEQTLRALELELGPTSAAEPLGARGRSNSLTSMGGFEFEHALLPLSLSADAEAGEGNDPHVEHKHVGLLHGM